MLHLHPITDLCRLSAVWWRKWLTFVDSLPSPHLFEMHLKAGEKEGRWTAGKILYATKCSSNHSFTGVVWWSTKLFLKAHDGYNFYTLHNIFCMRRVHWWPTTFVQMCSIQLFIPCHTVSHKGSTVCLNLTDNFYCDAWNRNNICCEFIASFLTYLSKFNPMAKRFDFWFEMFWKIFD